MKYIDLTYEGTGSGGGSQTFVQPHCQLYGCNLCANGIVSDFTNFPEETQLGGFQICGNSTDSITDRIGTFLQNTFPKGNDVTYYLRFSTPEVTRDENDYIIQGTKYISLDPAIGVCRIILSKDVDSISFGLNTFELQTYNYTFQLNKEYDIKIVSSATPSAKTVFSVKRSLDIQYTELGSITYNWFAEQTGQQNFQRTQWGFCGRKDVGMESYTGKIDLKHTGLVNNTSGIEYWFAT